MELGAGRRLTVELNAMLMDYRSQQESSGKIELLSLNFKLMLHILSIVRNLALDFIKEESLFFSQFVDA